MRERFTTRLPWVILAATLLLAVGASAFVWRLREAVAAVRFDNAIESATDRITVRLDLYTTVLRAAGGLFASSGEVTEEEFRRFAREVQLQDRFPGVQGIGWTERLQYAPDSMPDERHAIRFLEPLDDRNRAALGYDMYSDSTRRAAMARARDLGQPAMSGGVTLRQEIRGPRQAGLLLYVPVYAGPDVIPSTVEERRRLLRGFVYAPFRADDLFAGIFGTEREPRVSFAVYDGPVPDSTALLHVNQAPGRDGALTRVVALNIAGHPWTVRFRSKAAMEQGVASEVFVILLAFGALMTAVIGWLAFAQARLRAEAERANRAKSDFLAVMSHELRTPLNAIGGYTELIELGLYGPVTEEQRQTLTRVRLAKDHLLTLINNVLDFARLEAGQEDLRAAPVSVEALIESATDMILPLATAQGLTVRRKRGNPSVEIVTDRDKAQQVLLNLLSNAVKFTSTGGEIGVRWMLGSRDIEILVTDTGIGIPPAELDRVFDPFVQLASPLTRNRTGSGLGLAIARDIARALGGDVTATSAPGEGSTFVLRLPRVTAPRPSPGQGEGHEARASVSGETSDSLPTG